MSVIHSSDAQQLVDEANDNQKILAELFDDNSSNVRDELLSFLNRITVEGVGVADVIWLNEAYGRYLPYTPEPMNFTDHPSRHGLAEVQNLVRGLLNAS